MLIRSILPRPFAPPVLVAALALALGACGDDDGGGSTDTTADTSTPDTSTPDTSTPDTSTPDTSTPDTSTPDTDEPDTDEPDTTEPDTSTGPCACGSEGSCLEANDPSGCPTILTTCGGGLERLDVCPSDDLWATCERASTTLYLYYQRIDGWLANAAESCADTLVGPPGVFTVTPVPAGTGDVCSCVRSANACVQAYGAVCDSITCDAGLADTPCSLDGAVPGRCVTRDGNRELVFYGASEETAETTCNGASGSDYHWYPSGL